ncbi:hypothetical protein AcV7_002268 [Taiwanofungus camphoratus]|nr:hypothetical protein AcV7_002268 [Antrodia cinnamomea]
MKPLFDTCRTSVTCAYCYQLRKVVSLAPNVVSEVIGNYRSLLSVDTRFTPRTWKYVSLLRPKFSFMLLQCVPSRHAHGHPSWDLTRPGAFMESKRDRNHFIPFSN